MNLLKYLGTSESRLNVHADEANSVEDFLLNGVVNRAIVLIRIYTLVFVAYGFSSLSIIQSFDPTVTLWSNVWPRFVFCALPFILLHAFLQMKTLSSRTKIWLWILGLPAITCASSMIHVWPLMIKGHDIYLYVHGANAFVIATTLITLAPSMRYILATMLSFTVFLHAPILWILFTAKETHQLALYIGDYALAHPIMGALAYSVHILRRNIAVLEFRARKISSSFLGPQITAAIYDNKSEILKNRRVDGIVVQMDLRSYSDFYKEHNPETVRRFMTKYHAIVSREVGHFGGCWHKSVGDAHLLTFGVMEDQLIPQVPDKTPEESRNIHYAENAYLAVSAIIQEFDKLKKDFEIEHPVGIGAAMTFGDLEVRLQGDANYKRELDIDGMAVIRCARLEEYSKVIRQHMQEKSSLLVISPEVQINPQNKDLKKWVIEESTAKVRNFPQITQLTYKTFPKASASNKPLTKAS